MDDFIDASEVLDCRPAHLFRMNCGTDTFQEFC